MTEAKNQNHCYTDHVFFLSHHLLDQRPNRESGKVSVIATCCQETSVKDRWISFLDLTGKPNLDAQCHPRKAMVLYYYIFITQITMESYKTSSENTSSDYMGNSLHASLSFWTSPRSGFSSSLHVYMFRHEHLSLSLAPSAERNQHLGRGIYASWTPILGWDKLFQLDKMNLLSITWISLWKSTLTMTFRIHLSLLLSAPQGLPQDLTHSNNKPAITGPRNKGKPTFRAHMMQPYVPESFTDGEVHLDWLSLGDRRYFYPAIICLCGLCGGERWMDLGAHRALGFSHRSFFESCVNTDIEFRGAGFHPLNWRVFLTALLKKKIQGKNTSQILLDNIGKERHVNAIPTNSLGRAKNLRMA